MYEFHELANAFPLIEGSEFDDLVADIRQYGLREPVALFEGKILDGRNRYRACNAANETVATYQFDGDFEEAKALVRSSNLRRNLDASQRAICFGALANITHGGDRRSDQVANLPLETQADVARQANVSPRLVTSAVKVLKDGAPELIEAVKQGEIAVSAAAEIAKLPEDEQRDRIAQPGGYASLTGNNEWYTPAAYIERARRVMGGFDLDPASNTIAQQRVRADNFFTKEDNGLEQEWHGKVWLNPPYSQPEIGHFIEKLVPLLQLLDGTVSEADRSERVPFVKQAWFYTDSTPEKGKVKAALDALVDFKSEAA